jgi:hypothetical protein
LQLLFFFENRWNLELGLNGIFLGLNRIDFFRILVGFLGVRGGIRIDVRIVRISQIRTDFLELQCLVSSKKNSKKK